MPLLVAEGDSWFELPYTPIRRDVVEWIRSFRYVVRPVADYSHTLKHMAYDPDQHRETTDLFQRLARRSRPPSAIILSGGGNDLVNELNSLLNSAGSNNPILRKHEVDEFVDDVRDYFTDLVQFIKTACQESFKTDSIPILIHGYGYPVPDGRGFRVFGARVRGPWLHPVFEAKGYTDLQENTQAMKELVGKFNGMLSDFSGGMKHVHYVDVRDCLTNELEGYHNDWNDELHPTNSGFEKVAGKFRQTLEHLGIQPPTDLTV